MQVFKIKKTRTIFLIYWVLLAYVIAALIWWFIALNQQNKEINNFRLQSSGAKFDNPGRQTEFLAKENKRKSAQYLGEGITFLCLIITGAIFVFRAVRRQFRQSQQQQNFMMALTHELKTPIAVTKLNLETLQKHRLSEEQQNKLITNTIQETNRLNDLCNNMLLTSQIESGGYELTNEEIDLTKLVNNCIQDFITRYPKRKIEKAICDGIAITGDMLFLKMAINNLLDNAIKYSAKDTRVFISLRKTNDNTLLEIKDEGQGIAENQKQKIFLKYYRTGNGTMETKGTGLGLFLTKKIVQQHAGRIVVKDIEPHGSNFEVTFLS